MLKVGYKVLAPSGGDDGWGSGKKHMDVFFWKEVDQIGGF